MPSDVPPLGPDEVRRLVEVLKPVLSEGAVLVGGQALVAYTETFALEDGLTTTRDIDLVGDAHVVDECARLLNGRSYHAGLDDHTPHTGIVVFRDSAGHERQLDVLHDLYALTNAEVRSTALRIGEILVLHPLLALEDKVAQLGALRRDSLAVHQARVAARATRALADRLLADDTLPQEERGRAVHRLNTRVFKLALARSGLEAYCVYGVDVLEAAVLQHPLLPSLAPVLDYPRRKAAVAVRRRRRRRIVERRRD